MSGLDQVIRLVLANSPDRADRLALLDAPELAQAAGGIGRQVAAWCDDWRLDQLVPAELKLASGGAGWSDDESSDSLVPAAGPGSVDENAETMLNAAALGGADLVWMRLPQSLTGLDEYAALIAAWAAPTATVIGFGRNQDLNRSMNDVLSRHFKQVQASLGVGKYRALVARGPTPTQAASSASSVVKARWPRSRYHADLDLTIWAHGNTFATNRIDAGTRLLADHLDQIPGGDVLDFGSGSGVIAALLGRRSDPVTRVIAVDVSRWAVDSTRRTAQAGGVSLDARWADGAAELPDQSLDAIVSNPPFHRGVAKDSDATLALVADAARLLRPGGQAWLVFNSHLPWRAHLGRLVGPTDLVAQNRHYTLTRSKRRAAVPV